MAGISVNTMDACQFGDLSISIGTLGVDYSCSPPDSFTGLQAGKISKWSYAAGTWVGVVLRLSSDSGSRVQVSTAERRGEALLRY